MGKVINAADLVYLPSVGDPNLFREKLKKTDEKKTGLLLSDEGGYSPLAVIHEIKSWWKGPLYMELTSSGKNRDLIRSYMISAARAGCSGVVMAAGKMKIAAGMGKPVFDLDPAQMLRMAVSLRNEGILPAGFSLIVRSPEGSAAALERARYFIKNGADRLAMRGTPPEDCREYTILIREL